jgi:hypothetical protein
MTADGAEVARVRSVLAEVPSVREIRMFGGTAFMVNGHMTVAVSPRGFLVRVGPDEHDNAVRQPGTRAMEMRGRVMTGYVYVDPVPTDAQAVYSWVQTALRYNRTLPPKKTGRVRDAKNRTATKRRASR